MIRSILSIVLAFSLCTTFALADDDVLVGSKDNFDNIIGKDGLSFVKFYAPWCGHCKRMAQDFKDAASELKGKAVFVDLDATEEKELASKYGIRGFPTLKLFSKGEVVSDYKGGRTKEAMIAYIERASTPSITECADAAAVSSVITDNKDKTIFFGAALDKMASEFKKNSISLRDTLSDKIAFASVTDPSLLTDVLGKEVGADSVAVLFSDKDVDVFSGSPAEFGDWASANALPSYGELSRDTASLYTESEKAIVILFQDPDKKDAKVNEVMASVAKSFRGKGIFAWINSVELKSFAEHLGVTDKDPAIAMYSFKTDVKFLFDEDFSEDSLSAWVTKGYAGELVANIKSEPIPETNDEPVKVVVGDSWSDIVEDESKDVLIEQYAPWCGHCEKLAPVLDKVAKKLSGIDSIVIAKMDATKNDAPADYKAKGFPTMHYFKAGSSKGLPYEGGRDEADFIKFFKENATNKDAVAEIKEEAEEKEDL